MGLTRSQPAVFGPDSLLEREGLGAAASSSALACLKADGGPEGTQRNAHINTTHTHINATHTLTQRTH